MVRPPTTRRSRGVPSRADTSRAALRLEVAGVGAAPRPQDPEGFDQPVVQRHQLPVRERRRDPAGVDAAAPEELVGEQVSDARQARLVQQHGLHGTAAGQGPGELVAVGAQGVGTEAVLVGVELHAAQPAGIDDPENRGGLQTRCEPLPLRTVARWRVEQRTDGVVPVDQQLAGHAESEPQHPTGSCRPAAACRAGGRPRVARRTASRRARPR
ncbi:MAG: hypothetical protein U5R31_15180 [Acidimicrobiia bacterium]|nr:hypothetical protein [Acidimicrobiia bacterium]